MTRPALAATEEATLAEEKHNLRQRMRALRDALPADERKRAERQACELLAHHLLGVEPAVVALYAAIRTELDTQHLARSLTERGVQLVFPRVDPARSILDFHQCSYSELSPGRFGIPEPSTSHAAIPVTEIDCFVVPGLAFDASGTRLGWGRGFYDHTLTLNPRASRIGLCFGVQVYAEDLPTEDCDIPMTALATEAGVVPCRRR